SVRFHSVASDNSVTFEHRLKTRHPLVQGPDLGRQRSDDRYDRI
ncbi:MAG: hypothetical protein ACI8Y4_003054, partial [Candidatus Poriferisodalaceae bacterium]